jgi:hypothetical protein
MKICPLVRRHNLAYGIEYPSNYEKNRAKDRAYLRKHRFDVCQFRYDAYRIRIQEHWRSTVAYRKQVYLQYEKQDKQMLDPEQFAS